MRIFVCACMCESGYACEGLKECVSVPQTGRDWEESESERA